MCVHLSAAAGDGWRRRDRRPAHWSDCCAGCVKKDCHRFPRQEVPGPPIVLMAATRLGLCRSQAVKPAKMRSHGGAALADAVSRVRRRGCAEEPFQSSAAPGVSRWGRIVAQNVGLVSVVRACPDRGREWPLPGAHQRTSVASACASAWRSTLQCVAVCGDCVPVQRAAPLSARRPGVWATCPTRRGVPASARREQRRAQAPGGLAPPRTRTC